ncbi:hypothetical protein MSPP1_003233 [Malassezia sp. CBS 17886]|nr:hypothetical protein MSPP1_003233 [Malassezia sp. CBS 17886]
MSQVRVVPWVSVQPTVAEVVREVRGRVVDAEKIWVSAYVVAPERMSAHADVRVDASDAPTTHAPRVTLSSPAGAALTISDWVRACVHASAHREDEAHARFAIASAPSSPVSIPPTEVRIPQRTGQVPGGHSDAAAYAFDLSPAMAGTERWCAGGAGGWLSTGTWQAAAAAAAHAAAPSPFGSTPREILSQRRGYGVQAAQLIAVILSTSLDMSARVFSALDGTNPRTLTGHTRAVLCSAILGRGRDVFTGSADGTVRRWDVGSGKSLDRIAVDAESALQSLELLPRGNDAAASESAVLLAGLRSGLVQGWDVRAPRDPVAAFAPPASDMVDVERGIDVVRAGDRSSYEVLTASRGGVCTLYDMRNLSSGHVAPLTTWCRNAAGVLDVQWHGTSATITTSDGLPYDIALDTDAPVVSAEYAGWDADPVYSARRDTQGNLVTVGGPRVWAVYGA